MFVTKIIKPDLERPTNLLFLFPIAPFSFILLYCLEIEFVLLSFQFVSIILRHIHTFDSTLAFNFRETSTVTL